MTQSIKAVYWVPSLPHLLRPELNQSYQALADQMGIIKQELRHQGVKRVFYYSTSWISVLGQSLQAKSDLKGYHVDENWHDLVDLPFAFHVDSAFAKQTRACFEEKGYQTKLIDYEGFPVDTGTIVADKLINDGRLKTNMLSCCVYSDYKDTKILGKLVADTIATDTTATAVVCVSGLSGNYFTEEIDLREDRFRSPADDEWNQRFIGFLTEGNYAAAEALIPEYAKATKADMGMKALVFARGLMGEQGEAGKKAKIYGYGPIYGTGAMVAKLYG